MTSSRPSGRSRGRSAAAHHLAVDVQRFGVFSAAAVVDRYAALVDRATRREPVLAPPPGDLREASVLEGAGRVVDTGLALLDDLTSVLARTVAPRGSSGPGELVLPAAAPGSCTEVSVWVHNPTASPVEQVRLRASSLVASSAVLAADAVTFVPEVLPRVEPGGVGELRLRVTVPADQAPGVYQAIVISSVEYSRGIVLTLTVHAEGPGPE